MFVEPSVKLILLPPTAAHEKLATGARHGWGVGVGDGDGEGVGEGVGEADGTGVGEGEGVGVGVGDGEGEGEGEGVGVGPAASAGAVAIWAVEFDAIVKVWPPVNTLSNGVMSWNVPVTWTTTVLPSALAQVPGLHVRLTFAGATVTNEFCDSVITRHMTRFDVALHGWPAWNDVGLTEASSAPSRAAFRIVICE